MIIVIAVININIIVTAAIHLQNTNIHLLNNINSFIYGKHGYMCESWQWIVLEWVFDEKLLIFFLLNSNFKMRILNILKIHA